MHEKPKLLMMNLIVGCKVKSCCCALLKSEGDRRGMLKLRGGTTYLFWMKMAWDEEGVEGVQCDSGEVEDVSAIAVRCVCHRLLQCSTQDHLRQ